MLLVCLLVCVDPAENEVIKYYISSVTSLVEELPLDRTKGQRASSIRSSSSWMVHGWSFVSMAA